MLPNLVDGGKLVTDPKGRARCALWLAYVRVEALHLGQRCFLFARLKHMPLSERIVVDPEVLAGKPVIRDTRLAVEFILQLLAAGQSEKDILADYPGLTREDILACLAYASYLVHEYKAFPIPA